MADITISADCINCKICEQICPSFVYATIENSVKATAQNRCIKCGHCIAYCPVDAIEIKELGNFADIPESLAVVKEMDFENWLKSNRSVRNFDEKRIDENLVRRIIDSGCNASNAHNARKTKFIAITNKELLSKIEIKILEGLKQLFADLRDKTEKEKIIQRFGETQYKIWRKLLPELRFIFGQVEKGLLKFLHDAPALIASVTPAEELFADTSAHIELYQCMLSAHFLGLGSCWLGFLQIAAKYQTDLNNLLNVAEGAEISGAFILGYPKWTAKKLIQRKPNIEIL